MVELNSPEYDRRETMVQRVWQELTQISLRRGGEEEEDGEGEDEGFGVGEDD